MEAVDVIKAIVKKKMAGLEARLQQSTSTMATDITQAVLNQLMQATIQGDVGTLA